MSSRDSVTVPEDLLKDLDTATLEGITENESKFVEFFATLDLDDIKRINERRDAITNSNRQLALEIMNKKPEYEAKKTKLIDASLMANEFKVAYEQKYKQLKNMSSSSDHNSSLTDLREGVKTAEREAEDLADTFLDGASELSSDEFIKQFTAHRTTYWLRKVKAEKLDELLKQPAPYPPGDPVSSIPVPVPRHSSLVPTPTPRSASLPPKQQSMPTALSQASTNNPLPPSYSSLQATSNPTQSYYTPGGGMPVPHSHAPTQPTQPHPGYPPPTSSYQYGRAPPPVSQPTPYYPSQRPPQPYQPARQPYPPPARQPYPQPYGGYPRR